MFHHRAGKLKQQNKKHKTKGHQSSKRAVKREEGGKVNVGGGGGGGGGGGSQPRVGLKQQSLERDLKQDRLNRARQLKEQKRAEQFLQRRIGSAAGPPRIVAILPLSALCNTAAVRDAFIAKQDDVASVTQEGGAVTAAFRSLKQRFTFLLPRFGLMEALEAAKVADMAMFVLDVSRGAEGAIGEEGDLIISAIRAQGMPTVVGIIQGLEHHQGHKSQAELRRFGNRFFETEFGDKVKVAESQNAAQLQRVLATPTGAGLHWRQARAYLVSDHVSWRADDADNNNATGGEQPQQQLGTLTVRGYVRGKPLSVNQLVHLPGVGTFAMRRVRCARNEPAPLREARGGTAGGGAMDDEGGDEDVLAQADPAKVEALTMLAEPDDLAGEQTWPTREEEEEAAAAMRMEDEEDEEGEGGERRRKHKEKLLKSMSAYQASWFEGEEEEEGDGEEGDEEDEDDDDDEDADDASLMAKMETGSSSAAAAARDADADADAAEAKKKQRREDEELEFPDEVQTPEDVPARERFARYRALKSFRTSPWDPYESLPREYARIFKFQNFQASHARVAAEAEEVERAQNQLLLDMALRPKAAAAAKPSSGGGAAAMEVEAAAPAGPVGSSSSASVEVAVASRFEGFVASGTYVLVEIVGVPQEAAAALQARQAQAPLTVFSLLRYENRVSVLHFNIQKHPSYEPAVQSKDRLLFYTGFRSFEARPIFSEHNLNCDKHKFSRFLHGGRFAVASAYGPVSMPPCPVLIFKEVRAGPEGEGPVLRQELVASGTLHTVDPDRIILKRILLTGYPIRVKRRSAVVKHMFYNPEDVKWFKPAELSTKLGAAGHIRMPIGTHGLMKVRFNRVIQQSDTVCLPLYKRVYPKFVESPVE